jgi:hypothetical protein
MPAAPATTKAPSDTRELLGRDFRALLRSRGVAFLLVGGAVAGLVGGAATYGLAAAVIAPGAWCAVVMVCAFATAQRRSEHAFYTAFADGAGLLYTGDWTLLPLTPLLGAGDGRHIEHYMHGPLRGEGGDLRCALGLYTVEVRRAGNANGSHSIHTCNQYTICAVDIEAGIVRFPGVYLYPRKDILDRLAGEGDLRTAGLEHVEVEGAEFAEHYDIWIAPDQDELVVRQLFSPSLLVWLAAHPLRPCFEYRAGTLLVFVQGHLDDAGHLDWLLDASRHLAARFAAEVVEAR